jgi:hypothetical protein
MLKGFGILARQSCGLVGKIRKQLRAHTLAAFRLRDSTTSARLLYYTRN